MEILRAKTLDLRQTRPLTQLRANNSSLNEQEALNGKPVLESAPRRFVLELTNVCNLNCIMCGRNAATFQPTVFDLAWLNLLEPVADRVEEVTLMGWGEPTVHPQFADFLRWAHRLGLRKYFCTNGMRLGDLFGQIIENETDIIGVSMDGATEKTNSAIRRGADFAKILSNIETLTNYRENNHLKFPYMNFVFVASRANLHELPDLVKLAAQVGLDEVKVVYLTAFDETLMQQSLFNRQEEVRAAFTQAIQIGEQYGVALKLPHYQGEDPTGEAAHKPCYTGWRDFFIGSDGFVRPCMSSAQKLFPISDFSDFYTMWNSEGYQRHRNVVNGSNAHISCTNCYQSSFANWNKKDSFFQMSKHFSPDWENTKQE